jgi:predicted cupin superfamily sugar epimerase
MLEILVFDQNGTLSIISLGRDIDSGQVFQGSSAQRLLVCITLLVGRGLLAVGCTVSPGFDFADFELADNRDRLISAFPQHSELIASLTR